MSEVNSIRNGLITWTPTLVQNMDQHDPNRWQMANWSNGNPFNHTWQPDNISFNNGIMTITLDNQGCPRACDGKPYASGEYRTTAETYGYGYYEVRMKPAQGSGLMAGSFFTYRGTYGQPSHDEIDIEFLGKDPNCQTLQLNYYVEGRGGHEKIIQLPFNACNEFHNYGFKWTPDAIIWYVDGREVHRAVEDPSTPQRDIPYRPSKIMVNFWSGTSELNGWLGSFTYPGHPIQAQYDWIKYSTLEAAQQPQTTQPQTTQPQTTPPPPTPAIQTPTPTPHLLPSYILFPNREIGWKYLDDRTELYEVELVERLPLEQLEETVEAIAKYPYIPLKEYENKYAIVSKLKEIDQKYNYKLLPFFIDPQSYWDNAITLLSAYLQKSIELSQEDKIKKTLEYVNEFRKTIDQLPKPKLTDPHRYLPNCYKLAILDLIEAEATAQTRNQDVNFYRLGIENAIFALSTLIDPPQERFHPSKPDYFNIVKGIMVLADLYQQIGRLTYEQKYLEASQQLLQGISSFSLGGHLSIDLRRLLVDPFLVDPAPINLVIFNPTCEPGVLTVTSDEVLEALKFNKDQGYLRTKDVEIAKTGIFHFLRGIALIKEAILFVGRPDRIKTPQKIMDTFNKIEEGIKEIKTDEEKWHKDPSRNKFFY
ncbi:MAG: family 16 glycosylhydrolase, partial [Candidatus Margulisiibacteriota bacterium]